MRIITLACSLAALIVASPLSAQTLNVASAGDQNMVDYVKDYLGPMFEKAHPGVKVVSVGTGPGDSGSQKIYEKLDAQKNASATDFDVLVIHQKAAGQMVKEGLLNKYTANVETAKLATGDSAKNSLGTDVSGFVIPMFQSQTALAYNADMVKTPPATFLIKTAANLTAGSKEPGKVTAGKIARSELTKIAELKMADLNANDLDQATKIIEGSARSMGLEVTEG